jgi:FdhD protein
MRVTRNRQAAPPDERAAAMTGRTARRRVLRISLPDQAASRADLLATEEPLGIRVNSAAVTLTMRTPGDDLDLAAGFLVGEGVIRSAADIETIKICSADRSGHSDHDGAGNVADLTLRPGIAVEPALRRNFPHHERVRRLREGEYPGAIRFAGF